MRDAMDMVPVFVYGTLKPGEKMFRHISHTVRDIVPATITGRLYETPFGYPLLVEPGLAEGPAISGVLLGGGEHSVDVEVDVETGKVTILRYTAVQDVGTAIHPSYVEGQLQGGAAQGGGIPASAYGLLNQYQR